MQKHFIKYLSVLLLIQFLGCTKEEIKKEEPPEETGPEISAMMDGPYVFYEKEGVKSYTVDAGGKLVSADVSFDDELKVVVPYRDPEVFNFDLKKDLPETKSVFDDGMKIFAVSDIEGNYYALIKLLIGNGVVDKDLNWTYGKNHLVFNGDMVDRGRHVTQVLWLMYKLDHQAQKAGGHVHFILGNHDVMCMAGDSRYAQQKYLDMAEKLNVDYKELYGEKSEIGRWMRSKNAIEKINGYVFVHAGISPDVLALGLSFSAINELMRPYNGKRIDDTVPEDVYKLFKTSGVLWYRGYVKRKEGAYEKATVDHVNATLAFYNAKTVVVGHCLVDEICVKYGGKIVTMDVHHPEGKSSNLKLQALYIENNELYRVDEKANKTLLEKY
jgi:hypothetical protein